MFLAGVWAASLPSAVRALYLQAIFAVCLVLIFGVAAGAPAADGAGEGPTGALSSQQPLSASAVCLDSPPQTRTESRYTSAPALKQVSAESSVAAPPGSLVEQLARLNGDVLSAEDRRALGIDQMLQRDVLARTRAAAARENKVWQTVASREDWAQFRDRRIAALRASLGPLPEAAQAPAVQLAGTLPGEGYTIKNIAYCTRPGVVATANLYLPEPPGKSMPAILISHSHHNPKTQAELQDMGMTWARQGCVVMVPDHLGHGERRAHPFDSAEKYPKPFRVGRQDYYFRHMLGLQLHVLGDSLMGWMVWDLRRAVDVLLAQPGVDAERVILLGAVAGGGDPAAVAAALDERITAVVPFNFGGPQPDYPIPADAENDFYWFGVPYWETTRALRCGARDGFAHWVIVSAVAPRRLIYAHEFSWEQHRDPAWPRIRRAFELMGAGEHIDYVQGTGTLRGSPPESSHCNNIGPLHRSRIYPIFQRWFDMQPPAHYQQRREEDQLRCLRPEIVARLQPRPLHTVLARLASERVAAAQQHLEALPPQRRRAELRSRWNDLLGNTEPKAEPKLLQRRTQPLPQAVAEWVALEVESGIVVPLILLIPAGEHIIPAGEHKPPFPVVICLSQSGKRELLHRRAEEIGDLLQRGVAVCLADVRGTGETSLDDTRNFRGSSAAISQAELVLGQTLLGSQLRDLRSVLRYLRRRSELDSQAMAIWGESCAAVNPAASDPTAPLDLAEAIPHAEPTGALLALLGALYDDAAQAVLARGGLASYQSLLESYCCYVPHQAVVPGALTAGDLASIIAAIAPRAVRLERPVDGLNRPLSAAQAQAALLPAQNAYQRLDAGRQLEIHQQLRPSAEIVQWLLGALRAAGR